MSSTDNDKPEMARFVTEVPIADRDGVPIREGDVLESLKTGEVGLVLRIIRFGDQGSLLSQVGDLDLDM